MKGRQLRAALSLSRFAVIVVAATSVGAIGNGLYGIFAARNLPPSVFGALASILVLMGLVAIWSSGLQHVAAGTYAQGNFTETNKEGLRRLLDADVGRLAALPTVGLLVLAIPFALAIEVPVALTVCVAMLPYPALLMSKAFGLLIGAGRKFRWQIVAAVGVYIKFSIAFALFLLNDSALVFAAAVPLGALATFALAAGRAPYVSLGVSRFWDVRMTRSSTTMLLLAGALQLDVLAAPIVLGAANSGGYAIAASVAKPIAMLVAVIGVVSLPRYAVVGGPRRRQLALKVSLASLFIAGLAVTFLVGLRRTIGVVFFPMSSQIFVETVTPVALSAIPWAIVVALANMLAFGTVASWVWKILGASVLLQGLSLFLLADSATAVALVSGGLGALTACSMILIALKGGTP